MRDGLSYLQAQQLASKGRGNDSMLLHVTPNEMAGLHALANATGNKMTRNPATGLHEAGWFEQYLPAIAGIAAGALTGGAAAPLAAGLASGATKYAQTGSLQQGLMTGLMTGGMAGLGGAAAGAAEATGGAAGGAAGGTGATVGAGGGITANLANAGGSNMVSTGADAGLNAASGANIGNPFAGSESLTYNPSVTTVAQPTTAAPVADAATASMVPPAAPTTPMDSGLKLGNAGFKLAKDGAGAGEINTASQLPSYTTTPLDTAQRTGQAFMDRPGAMLDAMAKDPATKLSAGALFVGNAGQTQLENKEANAAAAQADEAKRRGEYDRLKSKILSNYASVGRSAPWMNAAHFAEGGPVPTTVGYTMADQQASSSFTPFISNSEPVVRYRDGGQVFHMESGGFVVPEYAVKAAGGGDKEQGLAALANNVNARPIRGPGTGTSDSIPAKIDGKQPAKVSNGEAYVAPKDVQRNGGSKAFYQMLKQAKKQRSAK